MERVVFWVPRALSFALIGLLVLLSMEALVAGGGVASTLVAFVIHLVPAAIVAAVLAFLAP